MNQTEEDIELVKLTKKGNAEAVVELIESIPPDDRLQFVNKADANGSTAIFHTVWPGHLDALCVLLSYGAFANHTNNRKNTALFLACEKMHKKLVKVLIEYGCDPNLRNANNVVCWETVKDEEEREAMKLWVTKCVAWAKGESMDHVLSKAPKDALTPFKKEWYAKQREKAYDQDAVVRVTDSYMLRKAMLSAHRMAYPTPRPPNPEFVERFLARHLNDVFERSPPYGRLSLKSRNLLQVKLGPSHTRPTPDNLKGKTRTHVEMRQCHLATVLPQTLRRDHRSAQQAQKNRIDKTSTKKRPQKRKKKVQKVVFQVEDDATFSDSDAESGVIDSKFHRIAEIKHTKEKETSVEEREALAKSTHSSNGTWNGKITQRFNWNQSGKWRDIRPIAKNTLTGWYKKGQDSVEKDIERVRTSNWSRHRRTILAEAKNALSPVLHNGETLFASDNFLRLDPSDQDNKDRLKRLKSLDARLRAAPKQNYCQPSILERDESIPLPGPNQLVGTSSTAIAGFPFPLLSDSESSQLNLKTNIPSNSKKYSGHHEDIFESPRIKSLNDNLLTKDGRLSFAACGYFEKMQWLELKPSQIHKLEQVKQERNRRSMLKLCALAQLQVLTERKQQLAKNGELISHELHDDAMTTSRSQINSRKLGERHSPSLTSLSSNLSAFSCSAPPETVGARHSSNDHTTPAIVDSRAPKSSHSVDQQSNHISCFRAPRRARPKSSSSEWVPLHRFMGCDPRAFTGKSRYRTIAQPNPIQTRRPATAEGEMPTSYRDTALSEELFSLPPFPPLPTLGLHQPRQPPEKRCKQPDNNFKEWSIRLPPRPFDQSPTQNFWSSIQEPVDTVQGELLDAFC